MQGRCLPKSNSLSMMLRKAQQTIPTLRFGKWCNISGLHWILSFGLCRAIRTAIDEVIMGARTSRFSVAELNSNRESLHRAACPPDNMVMKPVHIIFRIFPERNPGRIAPTFRKSFPPARTVNTIAPGGCPSNCHGGAQGRPLDLCGAGRSSS